MECDSIEVAGVRAPTGAHVCDLPERVPGVPGRRLWLGRALISDHGGVDDHAAFDRLCRTVYIAAQANAVNCTDAFDLAAAVLELRPTDQNASELALLSVDGAEAARPRMSELALMMLATVGFEPGFAEEPGWLVRIENAIRLVNQDTAASGLRHPCRLRVGPDEPGLNGNAYVQTADGHTGSGQGVFPACGADPVSALVAVADDAQDAVMHALWSVWPVCPAHRIGVHAREHGDVGVWWCAGGGGHVVAAIGEWQRL